MISDGPYSIQLNKDDIPYVMKKFPQIKCSNSSMLLDQSDKKPSTDLKDLDFMVENEVFAECIKVLAEPAVLVKMRIGGGNTDFDEAVIYKNASRETIVTVTDVYEYYIFQVYQNISNFCERFAATYAGSNNEKTVNYLPGKVPLESFILILHAVDSYIRKTYENLLEHTYSDNMYITYEEFIKTMHASIKSRDIRWILPAFIIIAPGMEKLKLDFKKETVLLLGKNSFIGNGRIKDSKKDVMLFAEASKAMGIEFLKTWMLCIGFEFTHLSQSENKKERLFIAPTGITNHMVNIFEENNKSWITHNNYTYEEFTDKLEDFFAAALKS